MVNRLRDEKRADGPQGFISLCGISALMSEALQGAILAVPEEAWEPYGEPHAEEIRECAEVPFVPGEKSEHKQTEPLSRLAGWGFGFASGRAVCLRAVLPPGILRW